MPDRWQRTAWPDDCCPSMDGWHLRKRCPCSDAMQQTTEVLLFFATPERKTLSIVDAMPDAARNAPTLHVCSDMKLLERSAAVRDRSARKAEAHRRTWAPRQTCHAGGNRMPPRMRRLRAAGSMAWESGIGMREPGTQACLAIWNRSLAVSRPPAVSRRVRRTASC